MKHFVSFFMVLFSVMAAAQTTVSGKVNDEEGKPVTSASVTVEEAGRDAIIAYGITNAKGEYKITFTSAESQVNIKAKAFNHKAQLKIIKNENQSTNFTLQTDATEIAEVKIKTKIITKRGDTISYDLKAFESQADRTLADVLKKMPGIDVNADGTILYQGEPLQKFYVNGKDLMEGGYGTINNSLPKDAVAKVEIMENHQPLKILQGKVPSDKAAINIKLKKSVTMTGRGEVGAGLEPFLWNVKLTPMFFGQKNQWVLNYKTNNNGDRVEREGMLLGGFNRWEGRRTQASQRRWISLDEAGTPSLPEKRYLFNNVHYLSANLLTSPFENKEWELKLNANYTNNTVDRSSFSSQVFEPSDLYPNGLVTSNRITNRFFTDAAKGEIIFTKNAKKGFFKNTTTWNGFWNADRGLLANNNSATGNYDLNESLTAPTGMIQNSLSTIIPWKEKMVNFMSYIGYQKDRQTSTTFYNNFNELNDSLGTANLSRLDQSISLNTFQADHSASVGFSYKRWTFTPEIGLNISTNEMTSQLFQEQSPLGLKFRNDFSWNQINSYTQVGINYKGNALSLNLNLPVNFYAIDYKDRLRTADREINRTVLEPFFWGTYDFASFFKFSVFGNVNHSFGNFGDLYEGQLLSSPRTLVIRNSRLPENRNASSSARLEYRNPLNNLFFNVRYTYGQNRRNLISRQKLTESGLVISELADYTNSTFSESQGAEIGKYFPKFKTNASVSFSNRDSNSYTLLLAEDLTSFILNETRFNGQTLGVKFNNTYFSWLSVDYNLSMNWNENKNLYTKTGARTSGWNHNLATYIYPSKNHTFGFFWDDMSTQKAGDTYRNSFFDVLYQYTWNKKKIDFELRWLNIANKKVYETISYSPTYLQTTVNSIDIRPSQFMFTVKFNFK